MDTLCMGYECFFQKITRWQLLSLLISTVSMLQILIFEVFFLNYFLNTAPTLETPNKQRHNKVANCSVIIFGLPWICCQAEMFNPSFAYTGLEEISCAPLSLCCHICSPFSCGIFLLPPPEGEMVQKQSINNTNRTKCTIAICILCGAKATTTNTASTTTYVNSEPLMRRRMNFYIVSHHLTNSNQLWCNDDSLTINALCASAWAKAIVC